MSAPILAVAIIGAGFSGLGAAIALKREGINDFVILESSGGVGGTWRHNTYPGCACDVPSHLYSFSFELHAEWSRVFAPQAEIRAYLERCVRSHGLGPHLRLGTKLTSARWDEDAACWRIVVGGQDLSARSLVLGLGHLSQPRVLDLPGHFDGPTMHTARWDHSVDLRAMRVAVVGTGASAIQVVPAIAPVVSQLTLFQRSPPWVIARRDRAFSAWRKGLYARVPALMRLHRLALYLKHESRAVLFTQLPLLLKPLSILGRWQLWRQVKDPKLRARLTPDYTIGCKRILLSDDYYPALQRPNVEVVPLGVTRLDGDAVIDAQGNRHAVDVLIWATGFHVSDGFPELSITGREGLKLTEAWRGGPEAYLGTAVAGFPNMSIMLGPNTGLGHNSMVLMVEAQVEQLMAKVRPIEAGQCRALDVRPEAQRLFNDEIQRRMKRTVWLTGCRSWYVDDDGTNRTLWPDYTWRYWLRSRRQRLEDFLKT